MASEGLTSLPLSMPQSTIYTLVTTGDVAKGLAPAHGFGGGPLCDEYLLGGFEMHAVGGRTPFVPVSKRIIDTLQDALGQYRRNRSPADVWIIFVEVPADDTRENPIRIHSADELAARCGHPNPQQFCHEALVEYSIPWDYVSHRVSLQALIDRGFVDHLEWPLRRPEPPHLWDPPHWDPPLDVENYFWHILTDVLETYSHGELEMGIRLAQFARMFGARAPLRWIANQLFVDCLGLPGYDENSEVDDEGEDEAPPSGWSERELCSISDGVETYLCCWLQGSDFVRACTQFKDLEARLQDQVLGLELAFQKDWNIGHEPFTRTLPEADVITFDMSYYRLLGYIDHLLTQVEVRAVELGL